MGWGFARGVGHTVGGWPCSQGDIGLGLKINLEPGWWGRAGGRYGGPTLSSPMEVVAVYLITIF